MTSKKYFSYISLLAAILLLWYIKKHQRGVAHFTNTSQTQSQPASIAPLPFNRHTTHLIFTKHARCRMDCRHIDETEVQEVLETGSLNNSKIEQDDRGKTYPLEGVTHDGQHVRIVVAPKNENLVVVTVIDLDKDWYCDCK